MANAENLIKIRHIAAERKHDQAILIAENDFIMGQDHRAF
jgi:hypothetical protein